MNKIIGNEFAIVPFDMVSEMKYHFGNDKALIKVFLQYTEQFPEITDDLLATAIYNFPYLKESFEKYLILI